MQRSIWIRGVVLATTALSMLFVAASAQAATRNMVGSFGVINPSVAPPFFFTAGPHVLGKKAGPYAPDEGWDQVEVLGTTASTFVGRQVTAPAGVMNFNGVVFRDFAAFPTVANLTKTYSSVQPEDEVFAAGGGPLAACPGPGCTASGAGTAISWCPPNPQPVTPAPGTVGNQIGDWDCASQQGAAAGAFNVRIAISNSEGANNFGGTYSMLRNDLQNTWRVLVQPGTDGYAEVSRSWMDNPNQPWTPGLPNFDYLENPGNPGPRLVATLAPNGAVAATFGCVNPTGTVGVGKTFVPGEGVIVGPGSNCGTPGPKDPGQGWGFALTTGDVEGSDPWPFISVTSAVPPGTAFAPNVNPRTAAQGFFFTRMGTDATMAGTRRNIVLLGGGVARDPNSGNLFFRILDLRFDMTVPEPAMGLGLVAGATALVALARRRRS
ncbi:MAG: PEP-CTERM sorting domain-containing protein [Deltaproteobacteria bacterium]|jgi:hypothetical protein|nr:PEP-CTERM sorting domain-containing protein [Deltaproteobacteria bacterium]